MMMPTTASLARRRVLRGVCQCSALALPSILLGGCTTSVQSEGDLQAGYTPRLDTLEGSLWHVMDQAEQEIKHSPLRMTQPELNRYLSEIACRLAGAHCADIRVYAMRVPFFNASMAPNGMMQIWSGLLLRCENESQVAAVVGHELGHYLRRHTLQRFEQARQSADIAAFLGIGVAVAGGGALANLPGLIALASQFASSREQEREADDLGLELMHSAGYAPMEAARIWQALIAEREAGLTEAQRLARRERDVFFATHPAPYERMAALTERAQSMHGGTNQTESTRHAREIAPLRTLLIEDELRLHQPERTLLILERLRKQTPNDVSLDLFEGEVYRLRNQTGDEQLALGAFERALKGDPTLAIAWRGVGIVHRRAGRNTQAAVAFERYLALSPDAPDRLMVQSYIKQAR